VERTQTRANDRETRVALDMVPPFRHAAGEFA
jgi:hypothetical protein